MARHREIEGLAHFLLVWQDVRRVELFSRKAGGGWDLAIVEPPAPLRLAALGVDLDIGELCEGVLGEE